MKDAQVELKNILDGLENATISECYARLKMLENIIEDVRGTELENVCSHLDHYLSDADIRAKDAKYKTMQDTELAKLKALLERGDYARAREISFLCKTPDL